MSDNEQIRLPDPIRRECLLESDIQSLQGSSRRTARRRRNARTPPNTEYIDEYARISWDHTENDRPPSIFQQYREEETFEEDLQNAMQESLREAEQRYREEEDRNIEEKIRKYGMVKSRLHNEDPVESQIVSLLEWELTPVYQRPHLPPVFEKSTILQWIEKRKSSKVFQVLFDLELLTAHDR